MRKESSALARFLTLAEPPHAGVICTDQTGTVRYCSRGAGAMFGYPDGELSGAKVADIILADALPADGAEAGPRASVGQRRNGVQFPIELTVVSVKAGAEASLVWLVRDTAESVHLLEDALTRMPNRAFCLERIRERLEHGAVSQGSFAVMVVAVDGVDDFSLRAGRAAGDAIVAEIAARLRHAVPGADLVGRFGGAEFCVIASSGSPAELDSLAQTIAESLGFPIEAAGESVSVTPKIGVAIAPADGDAADLLLEHARAALDRAKRGTATSVFAGAGAAAALAKRREMVEGIRRALDTSQFSLDFLPLVDLATGAVKGAEALLRWRHPDFGAIAPLDFIPIAEDSGMMIPVGAWVVREALRNAKRWNEAGQSMRVAVNISARQLQASGFTRQLSAAIAASGCRPEWLEIELTEAAAMAQAATVQMLLSEIRTTGIRTALDDFGTGHSSMAYLKGLPIDIIKIDRSFVDGVPHDNADASIVRAIVAFALCTGREVRAEGVTSMDQARWLHAEGCDAAQGFFFSRPVPADKFDAWLAAYHEEGLGPPP